MLEYKVTIYVSLCCVAGCLVAPSLHLFLFMVSDLPGLTVL